MAAVRELNGSASTVFLVAGLPHPIVKEIQDAFPALGKLERFENADECNPKKTVEIPKKLDDADVLYFAKTDGTSCVQCGEERWLVTAVAITHRIGAVEVGEASVAIAASSAHRRDALEVD